MPSKPRAIRGTLRVTGVPPSCPQCGHNHNVIRVWFTGKKQWACSEHFKITSTKTKEPTLKQRVLHRLPEADTFTIPEVFVNRKARRK